MSKNLILKVFCVIALTALVLGAASRRNAKLAEIKFVEDGQRQLLQHSKDQEARRVEDNRSPERRKAAQKLLVQLKMAGRRTKAPWADRIVKVNSYDDRLVVLTNMPAHTSQSRSFLSLCQVTKSVAFRPEYAALKTQMIFIGSTDPVAVSMDRSIPPSMTPSMTLGAYLTPASGSSCSLSPLRNER
jgi:hypothetical protein